MVTGCLNGSILNCGEGGRAQGVGGGAARAFGQCPAQTRSAAGARVATRAASCDRPPTAGEARQGRGRRGGRGALVGGQSPGRSRAPQLDAPPPGRSQAPTRISGARPRAPRARRGRRGRANVLPLPSHLTPSLLYSPPFSWARQTWWRPRRARARRRRGPGAASGRLPPRGAGQVEGGGRGEPVRPRGGGPAGREREGLAAAIHRVSTPRACPPCSAAAWARPPRARPARARAWRPRPRPRAPLAARLSSRPRTKRGRATPKMAATRCPR